MLRPAKEKINLWEKLDDKISRVPKSVQKVIGGDINGHIGIDRSGTEESIGLYGDGDRNHEGDMVVDDFRNHRLRTLQLYQEIKIKVDNL